MGMNLCVYVYMCACAFMCVYYVHLCACVSLSVAMVLGCVLGIGMVYSPLKSNLLPLVRLTCLRKHAQAETPELHLFPAIPRPGCAASLAQAVLSHVSPLLSRQTTSAADSHSALEHRGHCLTVCAQSALRPGPISCNLAL